MHGLARNANQIQIRARLYSSTDSPFRPPHSSYTKKRVHSINSCLLYSLFSPWNTFVTSRRIYLCMLFLPATVHESLERRDSSSREFQDSHQSTSCPEHFPPTELTKIFSDDLQLKELPLNPHARTNEPFAGIASKDGYTSRGPTKISWWAGPCIGPWASHIYKIKIY